MVCEFSNIIMMARTWHPINNIVVVFWKHAHKTFWGVRGFIWHNFWRNKQNYNKIPIDMEKKKNKKYWNSSLNEWIACNGTRLLAPTTARVLGRKKRNFVIWNFLTRKKFDFTNNSKWFQRFSFVLFWIILVWRCEDLLHHILIILYGGYFLYNIII